MSDPNEALTIKGWLMRGAIREDDYRHDNFPCQITAPNPQDGVTVDRPVNHFYDPIHDITPGIGAEKAFDWALGTQNALTEAGNVPDTGRANHYTVFDAREAMFRALTEMDKAGSKAIGVGGSTPTTPAEKEAVRKAYWATTFRALGDLAHLVEDMAQPQHTRGDPHLTECPDVVRAILGGKSLYEEYVEARATGAELPTPGGAPLQLDALPYSGYPIPRFNDYVSYFTTRHVQTGTDDATVLSRKGLADYSNRSFFTVRTNLNATSPRFDLPTNNYPSYGTQFETTDLTGKRLPGSGVKLLTHAVLDSVDPGQSRDGVPLTTLSAWDPWLEQQGLVKRYKLSIPNYDAMADLLIPRAVAYSAGLIDYFFRGRLEISPPDEGVYSIVDHAVVNGIDEGFTKVKLKLTNETPPIFDGQGEHPQAMGPGNLYAVAKYRRNPCYQSNLSGEYGASNANCGESPNPTEDEEIAVSAAVDVQSINATDPQPFSFDFTDDPIPLNATDLYLQVVFRGQLGSEADAVVVATKDVSEPTYYSLTNSSDYYVSDTGLLEQVENTNDTYTAQNIAVSFQDSSHYIAFLDSLPLHRIARVALLVDPETVPDGRFSADARAIGQNKSVTSRIATAWNHNQATDNGSRVTTAFNGCGSFRGTNYLDGWVFYSGDNAPGGVGLVCSEETYLGMTLLPNASPIPFDEVRF